ncbi:PKD domain-containing protein [Lentzea albidocapillata subsp. violacea]|uniref:PKD domain-containing protein n=1 Tax=Lentzea albidocapillata subsp. violacea TaxID=128104 RepID=A0A1G9NU32_9PSEU|nr:PKD domain-containing protein [Lentzea albidocapillata]SDL89547.1 PKD domain-containing protein [Lentzea albidocapillata subsp. violacea]
MFRRAGLTAIALAVAAVFAPAVAHAAPAGDDFDSATEITSLPLSTTIDTTGSTKADDDPNPCYFWGEGSVWQKYTAPSDGLLRVSARRGTWGSMLAVYTGQRGALGLEPNACVQDGSYTVHAKAGTTYYFMVVDYSADYSGPLSFSLRQAAPEPNDAMASATAVTVPSDQQPDLTLATAEPGEAPPSCDTTATRSVWYRYTPARAKVVQVSGNVISVHRAGETAELACAQRHSKVLFAAAANETYLIRAATSPHVTERVPVLLRTAPDISAGLSTWPQTPNVLEDTTFGVSVSDGNHLPFTSATIDLGDGTVLRSNGEQVKHRFTRDGDYQVTVTASVADGRTATTTRMLAVRTHDVSVAGLSVPASARAGQTKPINVSVANTRNDEDVTVVLYRVGAAGEQEREIGRLTQRVLASAQGRSEFPFAYSYRQEDAAAGQVTFRVRAEVAGYGWRGDDKGDDNEARATTTSVRPAAGGSALIN